VIVKDSTLDKSGTQQDSSVVPVTNIKDPGDHLTRGGLVLVSMLSQRATWCPRMTVHQSNRYVTYRQFQYQHNMFFSTFPLSTFQAQTLLSPEPAKRRRL